MPTADISGSVVAITGASSGIGEATALAASRAGAAVALAARRADRIEALAAQIEDEGGPSSNTPTSTSAAWTRSSTTPA
jgi:NADP-dependent 3-hydroxy acid dehydrogenase YdfG